jgi:hypothetical protein
LAISSKSKTERIHESKKMGLEHGTDTDTTLDIICHVTLSDSTYRLTGYRYIEVWTFGQGWRHKFQNQTEEEREKKILVQKFRFSNILQKNKKEKTILFLHIPVCSRSHSINYCCCKRNLLKKIYKKYHPP